MNRKERKNFTRRRLSRSNRHDKLISQYISFKHPEIYKDAEEIYKRLNDKYPNKRDLSKTIDFVQLTTSAMTYSQYYYYRKLEKKKQNNGETATKTTNNLHNMVLQIPLLSSETVADNMSLDIAQNEEVMTEIAADPDLQAVFNNFTTPGGETLDNFSSEGSMSGSENNTSESESIKETVQHFPLAVNEQDIQDLVDELVNDPELNHVFNPIQTPLEKELSEDSTSGSENNTSESESIKETVQHFPLAVNEQDMQDLVDELVNDPELNHGFNAMQTPLEKELSDIGW